MSVISLKNITKTYHQSTVPVHALNDISLEIDEGEFTAIIGPSGSGKTTLLNMIGGLDRPDKGNVEVEGKSLASLSGYKLTEFRLQNIGFVFQAYNLIPVLTAQENIEFIMFLQKESSKKRAARAIELLEAVGLKDKAQRKPKELSGGEQQRVAVARAIASCPKFILADEPTANLDTNSALNLLKIMSDLNREYNSIFIFSTHDPRVIKKATRVITLTDGKIASDNNTESHA